MLKHVENPKEHHSLGDAAGDRSQANEKLAGPWNKNTTVIDWLIDWLIDKCFTPYQYSRDFCDLELVEIGVNNLLGEVIINLIKIRPSIRSRFRYSRI